MRSWLGLQLLLSGALLFAVFAVEGRCCKEEESSSEEECHCEKRHHCPEECCEKRHPHKEEECCCLKRCHHEEEECCCVKRHHHEDEECCKKKHSHGKEEAGKKKHSHGKKESCKKKHSHAEEESGEKKDPDVRKKHPIKRHRLLEDLEEGSSELSEMHMEKIERRRIMELAAQTTDAVPHHTKEKVIAHFNRGAEGTYYKHLEDGQLEYKKALGVMVYIHMLLGETNCTKPRKQKEAGVEYSRAYLEEKGCQLLPELKQEKRNCTFGIFIDMRTEVKAVVSEDCTLIPGIKQLPRPFKGLTF